MLFRSAYLFWRGYYGEGEASPAFPAGSAACPAAELMRRGEWSVGRPLRVREPFEERVTGAPSSREGLLRELKECADVVDMLDKKMFSLNEGLEREISSPAPQKRGCFYMAHGAFSRH